MDRLKLKNSQEWERVAFIGWQSGAGGKKSFGDYLDGLGLGRDKEPAEPMTLADQMKMIRIMNAAFGGTEIISKG
jgi:hypothetical protein